MKIKPEFIKQFLKFLFLGLITYGIRAIVTPLGINKFGLSLATSYAIALVFVIIWGFIMNYKVVFKNKEGLKKKFIIYVISIFAFSGIDWCLVQLVDKFFSFIPYLLTIFLVTGFMVGFKFLFFKFFVFVD